MIVEFGLLLAIVGVALGAGTPAILFARGLRHVGLGKVAASVTGSAVVIFIAALPIWLLQTNQGVQENWADATPLLGFFGLIFLGGLMTCRVYFKRRT